jgi:hypothetical protein
VSLKEIKKEMQVAGKGHNETHKIVNPMEHTTAANNDVESHVPESGGTCRLFDIFANEDKRDQKMQMSTDELFFFLQINAIRRGLLFSPNLLAEARCLFKNSKSAASVFNTGL